MEGERVGGKGGRMERWRKERERGRGGRGRRKRDW